MCTINQDTMMYGSWDVKCNIICLSSWDYPFNPLTARKMKTTKMKKPLEIWSFYTSVPKFMIIRYTVPEMWRVTDVTVIFILGYTFPFYPSNSPKNENFKTWKKDLRYHHFTQVYQKSWSYVILFLRYGACWM